MKNVDEFMQKVKVGASKNINRLLKFREEILELRDVHNCSFSQIKDFLLEQKIVTCVSTISLFYKAEKEKTKEENSEKS